MTFDTQQSVQAALQFLTGRLDPIIAARLSSVLKGLPWTAILQQLDDIKGFVPKIYTTNDLQAQLRMITEKLGNLGYPFDTVGSRVASTLGNELRIVRNRWAHSDDFTALDAWRAHDFVCRPLEHFGDAEGVALDQADRIAALAAAAESEGITQQAMVDRAASIPPAPPDAGSEPTSTEEVTPDPRVFVRAGHEPATIIDSERSAFEPWVPVVVGHVSVLDDLPKKVAKQQVRALALEIAEFEGPIHIDRLCQLIAASFGVRRFHSDRKKKLAYQISVTEGLTIDADKFVWPSTINRETWAEFRPNDSSADRPFIHVSPVEIANAARFLLATAPGATQDGLASATLQTFGRQRRTRQVSEHLGASLCHAEKGQR